MRVSERKQKRVRKTGRERERENERERERERVEFLGGGAFLNSGSPLPKWNDRARYLLASSQKLSFAKSHWSLGVKYTANQIS